MEQSQIIPEAIMFEKTTKGKPELVSIDKVIYFVQEQRDIRIDQVRVSVDKISLSMVRIDFSTLNRALKEFCKPGADQVPKGCRYVRVKKYLSPNDQLITVRRRKDCPADEVQNLFVEIHDPDTEVQTRIHHMLLNLGVNPTLSVIEIAIDLYTDQPDLLQGFLEKHLVVTYNRQVSNKCGDTFYSGDLRRTSKGLRLYVKEVDGEKFLRLELNLRRPFIVREKLSFPFHEGQLKAFNLLKHFRLKQLDLDGYKRFERKKQREHIDKVSGQRLHSRNQTKNLYIRHLESIFNCLESLDAQEQHAMLRRGGIKDRARFFKPTPDGNALLEVIEKTFFQ